MAPISVPKVTETVTSHLFGFFAVIAWAAGAVQEEVDQRADALVERRQRRAVLLAHHDAAKHPHQK
jgi:hypothetical protein